MVSGILAVEAAVTSALIFFAWGVLASDAPMSVGNMRGTALAVLVIAVPLLVLAMMLAARGSRRALYVWAGALAYIAYNAVLFCFGSHFSSFFLLLTTMLALSFWALVTLLTSLDPEPLRAASAGVPVRLVAVVRPRARRRVRHALAARHRPGHPAATSRRPATRAPASSSVPSTCWTSPSPSRSP